MTHLRLRHRVGPRSPRSWFRAPFPLLTGLALVIGAAGVDGAGPVDAAVVEQSAKAASEDGYHDPDVFSKTTDISDEIQVDAGDSASIQYTFTVGAGKGIDASTSTITDYIDSSVFDLGDDLSNIDIAGSYAGQNLGAGDFAVTQDDDGNLAITLSDSGKDLVADAGTDQQWLVTLTLTTIAFEKRQTESIYNKAVLTGGDGQSTFYSDVTTEVTSFDEAYEVRKLLYDAHADRGQPAWSEQIDSLIDRDGNFIDNPFVYQIDFIAHGDYGTSAASPGTQTDELPDGVEFLGFIDPGVIGTPDFDGAVAEHDTSIQLLGGNLQATYDENAGPNGTVTVELAGGSVFERDGDTRSYPVYFAATVTNVDDQPIVNKLNTGGTATIIPVSASVTWQKVDSRTQQLLSGSEWEIVGPAGDDSATIAVTDDDANDDNATAGSLAVGHLAPGAYTLTETAAPDGYLDGDAEVTFTVTESGVIMQGDAVVDGGDLGAITNVEKTYAVGDITWIDSDVDGVQDEGEPTLPGVTVTLTDADGDPVTDVNDDPVEATVTDDNGRYVFDALPAGDYRVRFTLTDEQQTTYRFTDTDSGSDDAVDSDADPATDVDPAAGMTATFTLDDSNAALTTDYADQPFAATEGIDSTWDAGVVRKYVSVGDYVWLDADGDGMQGDNESGIAGVTLYLRGPDGGTVTDVFGDLVEPVVTGENGQYSFENLSALSDGGTYTVRIDRHASADALDGYVPTTKHAGDRAADSSTWQASTRPGDLTVNGERDATLDFGFVVAPTVSSRTTPTTPPEIPTTPTTPSTSTASTALIPPSKPTTPGPATAVIAPAMTTIAPPGSCVALSENGFVPGETVTVTITDPDGSNLRRQTVTADPDGVVAYCLSVAATTTVRVQVAGVERTVTRQVTITVFGESGSLSHTGFGTARYSGFALLLLVSGAALVLAVRRRRYGRHT